MVPTTDGEEGNVSCTYMFCDDDSFILVAYQIASCLLAFALHVSIFDSYYILCASRWSCLVTWMPLEYQKKKFTSQFSSVQFSFDIRRASMLRVNSCDMFSVMIFSSSISLADMAYFYHQITISFFDRRSTSYPPICICVDKKQPFIEK